MRPNQKCDCGECKRCKHRAYMRVWYARPENRERVKDRITARYARPEVKAVARATTRAWEKRNPEKLKAQKRARYALSRGYIERRGCEVCGEWAEMHHDDYSKPDEVRWLCRQHHHEHHRKAL